MPGSYAGFDTFTVEVYHEGYTFDYSFPAYVDRKIKRTVRYYLCGTGIIYAEWFDAQERRLVIRIVKNMDMFDDIFYVVQELDMVVKKLEKTYGELKKIGGIEFGL